MRQAWSAARMVARVLGKDMNPQMRRKKRRGT
jgi:hypothetical protein